MAKPINQFGGWLRFLQIGCMINAYGLIVFAVVFALVMAVAHDVKLVNIVSIVESIVDAALFFIMLRMLKVQSVEAPQRIIKVFFWLLMVEVVFMGIRIPLMIREPWTDIDTQIVLNNICTGLWYLIWIGYFKRSQRVQLYYGLNPSSGDMKLPG